MLVSDPTPLVADDGNATPLAEQTVTIKTHVADATGYTVLTTVTTAADGTFSLPVKPTAVTSYRAEWAGGTIESVVYPPASAGVRVDVKAKVTIAVSKYNRPQRHPISTSWGARCTSRAPWHRTTTGWTTARPPARSRSPSTSTSRRAG